MSAATKRGIKKLLLAVVITVTVTCICVALAGHLFWCYYREQWGISAWILHSPPHGRNYTDKIAVVRAWAACVGVVLGLVASAVIGGKLFREPSACPERNSGP